MTKPRTPTGRPAGTAGALVAAALVAIALTAGCADPDAPGGQPPALPEDPDAVVVQFVTIDTGPPAPPAVRAQLAAVPEITAYADGRVIVSAGRTGQVRELHETRVSPADLADLLAAADQAGLLTAVSPGGGLSEFSHPLVTRVMLAHADGAYQVDVEELHDDEMVEASSAQLRVRQAVRDLRTGLLELAGADGRRYRPAGLAVSMLPAPGEPDPEDPEPTAWPVEPALGEGDTVAAGYEWRCRHITGTAVEAALAAARSAQGATWSSAGRAWTLAIRPLLPHEEGCP